MNAFAPRRTRFHSSEWYRSRTCYSQISSLVLFPVELTTVETAVVRTRSRNAPGQPHERDSGRRRPGGPFLLAIPVDLITTHNKKARRPLDAGPRRHASSRTSGEL